MIDKSRIGLNRMTYPGVDLEVFVSIAKELGIAGIELRNDLPDRDIIDELDPAAYLAIARNESIATFTINAIQKFNLGEQRKAVIEETKSLAKLGSKIDCPAVVLCPNNDAGDRRSKKEKYRETVDALKELRPIFDENGIEGYVEPLGFLESSLNSVLDALSAIEEAGGGFRIVYDTFHHYLGPDTTLEITDHLDVSKIGIVHASGVDRSVTSKVLRDEHRGTITENDMIGNRTQIACLIDMGYDGPISLEPFSPRLAGLSRETLQHEIRTCLDLLVNAKN